MSDCDSRLNEKSILRLCGLKVSQIEELYLDDNSIGNQGLQFLLTSLLHNKLLRRLHLRNNDISDPGVSYLCDYLGDIFNFSFHIITPFRYRRMKYNIVHSNPVAGTSELFIF